MDKVNTTNNSNSNSNSNSNNNCGFMSCDKLDRVANWVGANVASAFFASLERCSCINLSIKDNEDDTNNDDRPLFLSHPTTPFSSNSNADRISFKVCNIYATICVFSASNFGLRCRINPSSYLPTSVSSNIRTLVIAAHPQEPNQFAVGPSDGGIHVFETLESEGEWGLRMTHQAMWQLGLLVMTFKL
ncbi:Protein TOPLESS [Glycine soja]|uniref:Protein TOPLESS n=1 Tax=Glycine soja TaxID=3848 RepID=A0A445JSR2_GLYSO|nr:Protein TOPLESS [Glycine soja]